MFCACKCSRLYLKCTWMYIYIRCIVVVFNDVCFCINVVYVIVCCVVNVCMFPQLGKNSYADWYEFKSEIKIKSNLLTGTTKSQFSCIHSSMMSDPNGTKFTLEMPPLMGGHIPSIKKFLQSFPKYKQLSFWKKFFTFSSFCTLWKNAITCVCVLPSGWNLVHVLGVKMQTPISNFR